jgi:hypothetical protein
MAVPKRKTSKARRNLRRSHHAVSFANVIEDKKVVNTDFRIMLMKRPECIMENKFLSLKLNLINYQFI